MTWRSTARGLLPYAVAAAGAFLLAYLLVAFFVFPADVIPNDARVPSVVGMSAVEAERALVDAGFVPRQGEERFNAAVPRGTVLEQSPPGGSLEERGTEVVLAVSGGQRVATVPEVVGLPREEAERLLTEARLTLAGISSQTSDRPRGEVLSSDPPPGTRITAPGSVRLVVSGGAETVLVPDVVGLSYDQARFALEQSGLRIGVVTSDPGVTSFGTSPEVLAQQPGPGEIVATGTPVRLRIALAPGSTTPPAP